MVSEPVRIALVGAGRMGRVHLAALRGSDEIDLIGVVEPVAGTRAQLADQGVRTYATVDELLERDPPEGVLIAAPSDQHPALVAKFAATGTAVLCEKPLGIRAELSLEATRTAAEAGLRLLFTSEPTTRPCAGNGCVVAGRFTVRANAPHDSARRLVAPRLDAQIRAR